MAAEGLSPADAPARLCALSEDARAAVLLDDACAAAGASHPSAQDELAEAGRELLRAVRRAADDPPEELEAQVGGGSVYAVRRPPYTLVAVARRSALSSLMRYDMRAVLAELEAATT